MDTSLNDPPWLYVCGAPGVSLDGPAASPGPRAHINGFLSGLNNNGVSYRTYLAGEHLPRQLRRQSPSTDTAPTRSDRLKGLAVDTVRLGVAYAVSRRALNFAGHVQGGIALTYERVATFNQIGSLIRARTGVPWVIESNGPFWYEASKERRSLVLEKTAAQRELGAYRDADLVVAVSQSLKEIIVDHGGCDSDRVVVIPNGTDIHRFTPRAPVEELRDTFTVGFVGYVAGWAGIDTLIGAVAEIRASAPEHYERLRVVIAGDGPALGDLVALAGRTGVASRFRFAGMLPWGEVPQLLHSFDVGYSGQRTMSIGSMYHSPQKLYEYQASALPLVASRHPDAESLIASAGSGWLFDGDDIVGLSAAIVAAMESDSLEEMGRAGRREVERAHSWDHRVDHLLQELAHRGLYDRA